MDSELPEKLSGLARKFRARVWQTDEAKVVKGEKGGVMAWANSNLAGEYLEAACPANILSLLARIEELEAEAERSQQRIAFLEESLEAGAKEAAKKAAELRAKGNALAEIALFFEMGLEFTRSPLATGPGPFEEARRAIGKAKTAKAKMILKMLDGLEAIRAKRREKLCEDVGSAIADAECREDERKAAGR